MSEKRQAIELTDFTVGLRTAGGVTLLSRSDALEGGAYIPPGEIWLSNDSMAKLIAAFSEPL